MIIIIMITTTTTEKTDIDKQINKQTDTWSKQEIERKRIGKKINIIIIIVSPLSVFR